MKKSIAGTALTASVLAGGLLGAVATVPNLAGAQEDDPAGEAPESETPDATPPAEGSAEGQGRFEAVFSDLVDEGVLTQEQADIVRERLREARPDRGPGRHLIGGNLDELTTVLGVTVDDLREAKENGQSLSDVAEANGVDPQAVVDILVADLDSHLDAAVEQGRMTEEESAERLAEGTERIEDMVNGELERPGFGPGGPGGPHAADPESD